MATSNGQGGEDTQLEDQEEGLLWKLQDPDNRLGTDVRPLGGDTAERRKAGQSSRLRTTSQARTTGHSQDQDDRAPTDVRASGHRTEITCKRPQNRNYGNPKSSRRSCACQQN